MRGLQACALDSSHADVRLTLTCPPCAVVLQVISVLHTLGGERGILRYLGALQVDIVMALMQILAMLNT